MSEFKETHLDMTQVQARTLAEVLMEAEGDVHVIQEDEQDVIVREAEAETAISPGGQIRKASQEASSFMDWLIGRVTEVDLADNDTRQETWAGIFGVGGHPNVRSSFSFIDPAEVRNIAKSARIIIEDEGGQPRTFGQQGSEEDK